VIAAQRMVDALDELCHDLEVPTPKSYGIDHDTWTRLTPLMAQQAVASGSPANNPIVPSLEEIERIYTEVYG
jgi:alcohol dehydrogenase